MSEWITDRFPSADRRYIYNAQGEVVPYSERKKGEPWKPIPKCEPYVKPRRWTAEWSERHASWTVTGADYYKCDVLWHLTDREAHAEAAERIAEIYNEVAP